MSSPTRSTQSLALNHQKVINALVDFRCFASKDLAPLLWPDRSQKLRIAQQACSELEKMGLICAKSYRNLNQRGGNSGLAYGLTHTSALKYGGKPFNEVLDVEHQLKIARFKRAVHQFAERNDLTLDADNDQSHYEDWRFHLTFPNGRTFQFYAEVDNSRPSEQHKTNHKRDGVKRIVNKAKKYRSFFNNDFYVIFQENTDERKMNALQYLQEAGFDQRMFWVTSEAQVQSDLGGKIFLTPRDYASSSYSFLDL